MRRNEAIQVNDEKSTIEKRLINNNTRLISFASLKCFSHDMSHGLVVGVGWAMTIYDHTSYKSKII
jgi:hypothetical protein